MDIFKNDYPYTSSSNRTTTSFISKENSDPNRKQNQNIPSLPSKPSVFPVDYFLRMISPKLTVIERAIDSAARKRNLNKRLLICTQTKFPLIHKVAMRFGMKEVNANEPWDLFWTDYPITVEKCKQLKPFQRVNHFPGINDLCQKDYLAHNLKRMAKIFPFIYDFFPKTWCLPEDLGELLNFARTQQTIKYICKPDTGSRGQGIFIAQSIKEINPFKRMICQKYIIRPYLIDGYKFDLRIYTLITSCNPLRIFVYNEGLARFATSRYREPNSANSKNVYMHLTNYAVNKHSRTYVADEQSGSKRRISTLIKLMCSYGLDVKGLWDKIDDIIIKTIIAGHPVLKDAYKHSFPRHDAFIACFELLGFDILVDHNLKPYLIEVNHSPSLQIDAKIDKDIKESLLVDTFKILDLSFESERYKDIEFERKKERKSAIVKDTRMRKPNSPIDCDKIMKNQNEWEASHLGNYRLIYPTNNTQKYEKLISRHGMRNKTPKKFSNQIEEKIDIVQQIASRTNEEFLEDKDRETVNSQPIGPKRSLISQMILPLVKKESRVIKPIELPVVMSIAKKIEKVHMMNKPEVVRKRKRVVQTRKTTKKPSIVTNSPFQVKNIEKDFLGNLQINKVDVKMYPEITEKPSKINQKRKIFKQYTQQSSKSENNKVSKQISLNKLKTVKIIVPKETANRKPAEDVNTIKSLPPRIGNKPGIKNLPVEKKKGLLEKSLKVMNREESDILKGILYDQFGKTTKFDSIPLYCNPPRIVSRRNAYSQILSKMYGGMEMML